ncbi:YkuJ family protein [Siminovitchia fortis]|uniref:DUF1797 family protein n=1 Tax=Siminovitchia fortis TaxID=254758 RepID=A0A451GBN5_9BACI|nr:YkuJ family protein [Siminovitchia fortis]RWR12426.1 DUF1797 family protein [Siminovitchia fortis]WHY83473.1 YkuJ family protein [Siminovitchia fortis]
MSQLLGIIQRLQTMQSMEGQEDVPQRQFEVNGKVICQVKYFSGTGTFEVEEYDKDNKQTYQFDDIDAAAIEIFDIVQEEKALS